MSDDILAFLRARLDEDEQLALSASPGPWRPDDEHDEVLAADGIVVAEGFALSGQQLRATVDHIARHDPTRVLAEVDAKRRIVTAYENYDNDAPELDVPESVLRLLALPYASHPNYEECWRL